MITVDLGADIWVRFCWVGTPLWFLCPLWLSEECDGCMLPALLVCSQRMLAGAGGRDTVKSGGRGLGGDGLWDPQDTRPGGREAAASVLLKCSGWDWGVESGRTEWEGKIYRQPTWSSFVSWECMGAVVIVVLRTAWPTLLTYVEAFICSYLTMVVFGTSLSLSWLHLLTLR